MKFSSIRDAKSPAVFPGIMSMCEVPPLEFISYSIVCDLCMDL